MLKSKHLLLCILMILLISLGASLTIKAAIGVGAWDALSVTGNSLTGIKVGTIQMLLNFICIGIQLVILKRDFHIRHVLQIGLSILIGIMVNFFLYIFLGHLLLTNYISRLVLFLIGIVIESFAMSIIMTLDVITFPLEGACMAFARRFGFQFHKVRQYSDIVFILIVFLTLILTKETVSIREGTVLMMLLYGPIMGFFMTKCKPFFQKQRVTD
ncbi:YczE/YyaS/YitT family protein [Streptococcus hyointestinalis]|nr:hypothetical protein [Streptococcus hyointestinalis]